MKRITILLLLTFIVVLLAACGGNDAQPTATAAPAADPTTTAAPAVEPTAEPTAPPPTAEMADLGALAANPWQWVSFTDPLQQFEVEEPERYLLTFNEDSTVSIKADCNNASGSYTADDGGSLTIEVGPMTMAACPPESRSDQFVQLLGGAARYFFEEGFLYIDLFADGGTMAFAVAGEQESAGDMTSYPWLWTSFTSPVEQFEVESPENYVVTFNEDTGAALGASGTVAIVADCNNASGSYTADGGSLTIEIGPMTMAACPPDSRSDQFVTLLGSAARYFFEDAMLYIDLLADGGTMVFAPEGEAEMAEAAADSAADPASAGAQEAGVTLVCSAGDWSADCADGPRVITGEAGSGNFALLPDLFPNPTAALIDVTNILRGEPEVFVPESGQILGIFTDPLFPLPAEVRINLPIVPTGATLDLDNDGQKDAGVQVYALTVASNIINDSYLQQLEQAAGMTSILMDSQTGAITEGTFLVYAPDAEQGFPAGAGADGKWFTPDDPSTPLPAGYTVATLGADGTVALDRSPEVAINTIEAAEQVSPDFADQGLLESYNSLIDVLAERYAYTELRNLDWEEIRAEYLPQIEQADADQDLGAYFLALDTLAKSLHDSHVAATNYDPEASLEPLKRYLEQVGASVGASTFAAIDESTPAEAVGDEILVLAVGEDSPAAEAGWVPGTEIVSIDGEPASERLETIPLLKSVGTETVRRVMQARAVLNFAEGQSVTIGYRLPDTTEVLTATMVAGDYDRGTTGPPAQSTTPVTYEQMGNYAVVRWSSFIDYVLPKIAVLEEALAVEQGRGSGGTILDLRGNTGGWLMLYETMVSYFFTADDPMPANVFDWYSYDLETGEHVRSYAVDYMLSAPRPELAYTGPVAVLVDEGCASACEYFTQHLQVLGRATVIGQFPSSGAGGPIERVKLPGGTTFQFTKGGTYFAGTDEPNLEAKGVVPDIQVPVTLETEQAKIEGEDPVMEAALAAMPGIAARHNAEMLERSTWQWTAVLDRSAQQVPVDDPAKYTVAFSEDDTIAITADCNQASGEYTLGEDGTLTITLGPTTAAACEEGSLSAEFLAYLGAATSFQFDANGLLILLDPESGALGLVFEAVESALSSAGELPAELVAQLDAFLQSQVWTEGGDPEGSAPGLVLLVDTLEGRYLNAAGVSSIEDGTPMQTDDILEIGSNTKSMTIVLLMQLQEEGVLSMDDMLSDWLPEQAAQLPNGEQITLRQMAQHTAGLWDYADDIIGGGIADLDLLEKGYRPEELVQYAADKGEPYSAPGEGQWHYSNTGYVLLGMIAEKAAGKSLGELYQERIFDPLGLETAVLIEGVPQEGEITTQGYWWTEEDEEVVNTTNWNASQGWAAGAVAMSAADLATYGEALAAGELLQDEDSLAQMLAFDGSALYSVGAPYGLGLIDFGNGYWGHEGQTAGFQTLWYTNADEQVMVVGLTNSATYSAYDLLNVLNILGGEGAKPLVPLTLLPIGDDQQGILGEAVASHWDWVQMADESDVTDVAPGTILLLFKDGSAKVKSDACGEAPGTFAVDPSWQIDFDLDASGITCDSGEPAAQLLGLLDSADTWRFENGRLSIMLDDGGSLLFELVNP